MARLGLGPAELRGRNPGLIYCSISGYGAEGPLAQSAGHDGNYLAAAGVLHRNGVPPRFFDPPIADLSGSLFAVIAISGSAAIAQPRRPGLPYRSRSRRCGDAAAAVRARRLRCHRERCRSPNATYLNGGAAYYQVYATGDGRHVMVGAVEAKFWQAFCEAAGHPEWIARQDETLPQHGLIADVAACLARP